MVFAFPPRQFYRDGTPRYRLPGLRHLDNFALTRKLASIYRDCAKTNSRAHARDTLFDYFVNHEIIEIYSGNNLIT
jgi:hypothetical protein